MLFHHCLTIDEIELLVRVELEEYNIPEDESQIHALFSNWNDWIVNFICLNYLLSRVLERKQKSEKDAIGILRSLHELPTIRGLGLDFDEMDDSFVSYMLRFSRDEGLTLEDNLREIRHQLSEYKYW